MYARQACSWLTAGSEEPWWSPGQGTMTSLKGTKEGLPVSSGSALGKSLVKPERGRFLSVGLIAVKGCHKRGRWARCERGEGGKKRGRGGMRPRLEGERKGDYLDSSGSL